jgi:hypothetical protein
MTPFMDWFLGENLETNPYPDNWEDIFNEYMSLRENKSSAYMLNLVKEITFLKAKYQIVEHACTTLLACFEHHLVSAAADLVGILKQYNHRHKFDLTDEKMFSQNIRATLSSNKKLISTWQRKETELEDYQKKHAGNEWTRKTFFVWAVTLTEHFKQRIDLDIISVAEWCIMLNKYEAYCEVQMSQNRKASYNQITANNQQYGKRK